jgi:Protein of unknown function (DUF2975)
MTPINVNRYARVFEILCMILIPVVLLSSPLVWFFGDKFTDATYGLNLASFTLTQRTYLALIELVSNAMVTYALIMLIRIARNFQKDQIFTATTVALFMQLRKVAGWWALYTIVYTILFHSYFTTTIPMHILIASLGAVLVTYIFIFVFLSILATLIIKATQLQGDQDLTV